MNTAKIPGDKREFPSELFAFSTAEIERTIFFGLMKEEKESGEAFEKANLMVVHGEMYQLIDAIPPLLATPRLDRPALVDLVGLDSQET